MRVPVLAAAALAVFAAGCSQQTINSAASDAAHNATVVNREAQRAARKAKPQWDKFTLQSRVQAALSANANLPRGLHVRADTDTVYLRGTADTSAQKQLAGRVARETVPDGTTVKNEIPVSGS